MFTCLNLFQCFADPAPIKMKSSCSAIRHKSFETLEFYKPTVRVWLELSVPSSVSDPSPSLPVPSPNPSQWPLSFKLAMGNRQTFTASLCEPKLRFARVKASCMRSRVLRGTMQHIAAAQRYQKTWPLVLQSCVFFSSGIKATATFRNSK